MVVRTNVFALNAHRNMKNVGLEQGRASSRLASGYRINSAADDAAGLAISETMRAQIRGLDQASRNAQDGQALIQTTEGGMQEITNMLQRARELLVQSSNDTNVSVNRTQINQELTQLATEISSMQTRVEFNTRSVLNTDDTMWVQTGANSGQGMEVSLAGIKSVITNAATAVTDAAAANTGETTGQTVSNQINNIQTQLDAVNLERSRLGAMQNRLDYTARSLDISSENLSDSESRVRNADMAREMMRFTMANVLQQASVSMLAQANQLPNNLLQVLR